MTCRARSPPQSKTDGLSHIHVKFLAHSQTNSALGFCTTTSICKRTLNRSNTDTKFLMPYPEDRFAVEAQQGM
eukprot:482898-Pelagomonas_calceolata.AAC.3